MAAEKTRKKRFVRVAAAGEVPPGAVRAFDIAEFEARLSSEALAPVLTRAQLDALETRRKVLLERVAELEALHGEAIWAWD